MSSASKRKRAAQSRDDFDEVVYEVRRCKLRRRAWLREKEVGWWESRAQLIQGNADMGSASGVFDTFRELRQTPVSPFLGDAQPPDVQRERDAWGRTFSTH